MFGNSAANLNLIFAIGAFLVCLLGFPLTMRMSRIFGLVDMPSISRKHHLYETPLVGGITVFFAFFLVSGWFAGAWLNWSMLFWVTAVVALGAMDDLWDISFGKRLIAQAAIIVGIVCTDGLLVYSVGDIFGQGEVLFSPPVALCVTIFTVVGAGNAVNMADGVDGLLGSVAMVSLFTLLMIGIVNFPAQVGHRSFTTGDISAILGALAAFLLLNSRFFSLSRALVFLGDAGSTAIGFCLVFLLVDYTQGPGAVLGPVAAGWILGLPLLDASSVIVTRLLDRRSPFAAGRDHLHHLLLDSGMTVNQVVALLTLAHAVMVLVGVSAGLIVGESADLILFWSFIVLAVFRVWVVRSGVATRIVARYTAQEGVSA
jgi:UDP-GlcNAc:undecaprenyl-phosphate GlcNAc-1-phosphate transferase